MKIDQKRSNKINMNGCSNLPSHNNQDAIQDRRLMGLKGKLLETSQKALI